MEASGLETAKQLLGQRVEVRDAAGRLRKGGVMMLFRGHATVILDDDGSGAVELVRVPFEDLDSKLRAG